MQLSIKANTSLTATKYAKENHDYGKEGGPLRDNDERHYAASEDSIFECFIRVKVTILDVDKMIKLIKSITFKTETCFEYQFLSID